MHYNKLVRDKIPEVIRSKGGVPVIHIADDAEYWTKLKEKLSEEVEEFQKDENEEELADIFEVLDAICVYKNFSEAHIRKLQKEKANARGAFIERVILDES